MQLPAILFFFLCPFIPSVFSNPLGQDKVQITVQLSSDSPNSLDKPDLSPVAPMSWGYVGTGTYYIVSLVDDYALVPTEYITTAQTDIVLRKFNPLDGQQLWSVVATGYGDTVVIYQGGLGWLLSNSTVDNAYRKNELLASALWRLNKEPYASYPGAPIRIENVDHCTLVLDQNNDFPIGNGAPVITYPKNNPPSKNQGWKFLLYGATPGVLDTKTEGSNEL